LQQHWIHPRPCQTAVTGGQIAFVPGRKRGFGPRIASTLFRRTTRSVALTDDGEMLLGDARRLLQLEEAARHSVVSPRPIPA